MFLVILGTGAPGPVGAQGPTVTPAEAGQHVGENVTVVGTVTGIGHSSRSNTTFINFGGRFPNHKFTAVIFRSSADRFENVDDLDGKRVAVTGKIKMYRGKPEIVLSNATQLRAER
jgi:DNA/RNA endonuclease YhcR with UshA esterase domain